MRRYLISLLAAFLTTIPQLALLDAARAADEPKTVLITGANRGLGLEFAREFHTRGYRVIGTARDPAAAEELKALGVRVEQLDVADTGSAKALASRLGDVAIDILINNAGIFGVNTPTLAELDVDKLHEAFTVNSIGPLRVTQALLKNLRQGHDKKIVNISTSMASISDNTDGGGNYAYRSSKAALNMIGKSLAGELGREDFIVVMIHPGWVRTDMGGPGAPLSPEESIGAILKLIDDLKAEDNGRFMDYKGQTMAW
jgi:NAD(P)-dependent dehydrogenase (short-subunit alcohol dehydrogenase family)